MRILTPPGTFVIEGRELLEVVTERAPSDDAASAYREGFVIGADRTGTQDLSFYFEQLVELAIRALSPGINDPGTARACIDRLEQALCRMARRGRPSAFHRDEQGEVRVIARPPTFAASVEVAFGEIGRYGSASLSVIERLLRALSGVAASVEIDDDRRTLAQQVAAIASRIDSAIADPLDRRRAREASRAALNVIGTGGRVNG